MAMQAGLGVSRILVIVGAGYTGTILLQNGKLSDFLSELQSLLKGDGKERESGVDSDPIAAQIRHLAMEVKKLASGRPITVVNSGSGPNGLTSLIIPAAAVGALGYGYMKWKGITFSDLMYVTKQNMSSAVANLTKHLESVSEAVAATKRHLTQRIENLNGKMDEQVELSKILRHDVTDVRDDISRITNSLDELEYTVNALGGRMYLLDDKQDLANKAVLYLCAIVSGLKMKMPERVQAELNAVGSTVPNIMGLKDVVQALEPESKLKRSISDGLTGDGLDVLNNCANPRVSLVRRTSIKG